MVKYVSCAMRTQSLRYDSFGNQMQSNQRGNTPFLLLLLLPLLIAAVRVPFRLANFYPQGDMAVLEIGTLHASTGSQLLGPYSRFHWNHPGPIYFYLLVPLYVLSGRQSWSLVLSAILINATSIILILKISAKRGGPILFRWTILLLAFLFLFLGKKFLSPWNPDITMLPLAALFSLAAAACIGSFPSLMAGLFVGTFLVQTHIAYLPLVVVLLGLAAICQIVFLFRSRRASKMRTFLMRFGLAILFLLLFWLPPIWEQLHSSTGTGNFSKIVEFFTQRVGGHTFAEALFAVTSMMVPPFELRPNFSFTIFIPLSLMIFTIFVVFASIKKNRPFNAALCMLTLIADVVTILSAERIVGGMAPYLIQWVSIVALINWIPLGFFVWQKVAEQQFIISKFARKWVYVFLILSLTAFNTWVMFVTELVRHEDVTIEPLFRDLTNYLKVNEIQKPLIYLASRDQWRIAAGVILQLYKTGDHFAIQGTPVLFGPQVMPAGNEDAYLWLFNGVELHRVLKLQSENHLISRERNFFIYEVSFSRLENSGLEKLTESPKRRKSH